MNYLVGVIRRIALIIWTIACVILVIPLFMIGLFIITPLEYIFMGSTRCGDWITGGGLYELYAWVATYIYPE